MKICKLLLASVGATVLLGALVSSASAGRLEFSNQAIRSQWRSVEMNIPADTFRCQVTLEGTLHARTMVKMIGTLMGFITRAIRGPCVTGSVTILTETLPWHVRYSGFNGILPEFTSLIVHVIDASWRLRRDPESVTCLARSTASRPIIITFHHNTVSHRLTEAGLSGRIPTGIECFGVELSFTSDSGVVAVSNFDTSVLVSLI